MQFFLVISSQPALEVHKGGRPGQTDPVFRLTRPFAKTIRLFHDFFKTRSMQNEQEFSTVKEWGPETDWGLHWQMTDRWPTKAGNIGISCIIGLG